MKKIAPFVAIAVFFCGRSLPATQFIPYPECLITDANGRYYVVVKRNDAIVPIHDYGPVTLTIAERASDSPPVRSASAMRREHEVYPTVDPEIKVRDGDKVHCHIELKRPPGMILVSSTGRGIVTLDEYGFNNLGTGAGDNDLVIYSLDGRVLHRKGRMTLFEKRARGRFRRGDGFLTWLRTGWLDEMNDHIVVVGARPAYDSEPYSILSVDLASGDVRREGLDVIDRAIADRNRLALIGALDLAIESKLKGSIESLPILLDDELLSFGQRLRCAVLLASLQDLPDRQDRRIQRGAELVSKVAWLGAKEPVDVESVKDVSYAIEHLTEFTGRDALPILLATLRKNGRQFHFALAKAFQSLGRVAVPSLVAVLEDDDNLESQLEATNCLGYLGADAEQAVPALIKALHKNNETRYGLLTIRLDTNAAWALEQLGNCAQSAIPDLERLAADGNQEMRDSARRALRAIRSQ